MSARQVRQVVQLHLWQSQVLATMARVVVVVGQGVWKEEAGDDDQKEAEMLNPSMHPDLPLADACWSLATRPP